MVAQNLKSFRGIIFTGHFDSPPWWQVTEARRSLAALLSEMETRRLLKEAEET